MQKTPCQIVVLACGVALAACADPAGTVAPGKSPLVAGMIGSGYREGDPPPDTAQSPLRDTPPPGQGCPDEVHRGLIGSGSREECLREQTP